MEKLILFQIILCFSLTCFCQDEKIEFNTSDRYSIISQYTLSYGRDNRIVILQKDNTEKFDLILNVEQDNIKDVEYGYGINYNIKISPNGDTLYKKIIWFKNFQPTYIEREDCYFVVSSDGNLVDYSKSYLSKCDKNWNLLWTKSIGKPQFPCGNTVLSYTSNNELLFISEEIQNPGNSKSIYGISIKRFNLSGKLIQEKFYKKKQYSDPVSLIETYDKNYLITASTSYREKSDLWLIKINSFGDTLWTRVVNDFSPSITKELKDSSIILYGRDYCWPESAPLSSMFLKIIKVSKTGSLIWEKVINENYYEIEGNFIELSNGNCLFSSSVEPVKDNGEKAYIFELDKSGNKVYDKRFEFSLGIWGVPFLIMGENQITMISQKRIGNFGDPFHFIILFTILKV